METTLGGERLGSGNKQKVQMRTYERSTHDLSYVWRSTQAPGTLVPFMTELGLPGDTFDIDLNTLIMTHPTIGPLLGSFKIQLDVFECPIRLYNGKLHMNKLGIGLDMSKIKLPQIEVEANTDPDYIKGDNDQINPSCILSYLNMRGIGISDDGAGFETREFNAVPYLAYWDIYKNYYANKQEEIGFVCHNYMIEVLNNFVSAGTKNYNTYTAIVENITVNVNMTEQTELSMLYENEWKPVVENISFVIGEAQETYYLNGMFDKIIWQNNRLICTKPIKSLLGTQEWQLQQVPSTTEQGVKTAPQIVQFPLTNIDDMRELILGQTQSNNTFKINKQSAIPYSFPLTEGNLAMPEGFSPYCKLAPLEGLAVKTYQSDLFNNWISTEWIDGTNGINEITSIDTSGGSFNIDTLNLSNKVYNMLNRIAISGGSYDDWLDAVYTHERMKSQESPAYMGGLIRELAFEEVVSNSASGDEPLGTLAGRGQMTGKKKGGRIRVKVNEPSYIMGIISLTPRLDYSQGNKWDTNLKTMNDFHKPQLDEIGFQDLITDQLAWWDTKIGQAGVIYKSAGKQPAWMNYMTNVNQTRGNFAEKNNQMWMTLNRRYENNNSSINDLTTYIDPANFNHIFADTSFDAQNFWTQISVDITARRKMSAKIIPNL